MQKSFQLAFVLLALSNLGSPLGASELYEARTVYLVENSLAGIELFQKFYYVDADTFIMVREQSLFLSISSDIELGFKVPIVNQFSKLNSFSSRLGDLKIHLNFATDWFKEHLKLNYFLEYNVGSGPKIDDLGNHPMEGYGYPEWRTGLIMFKRFKYFSLHGNLFYVFRNYNEAGLFDTFFEDGQTLNLLNLEAYRRGLGFNPKHPKTFFNEFRLKNDNIEYLAAVNTELFYPFVPFFEVTFSHDFYGEDSPNNYPRPGPGFGVFRSQIILGAKFFMAEDKFSIKLSLFAPVGQLANIYGWGKALGIRLDF